VLGLIVWIRARFEGGLHPATHSLQLLSIFNADLLANDQTGVPDAYDHLPDALSFGTKNMSIRQKKCLRIPTDSLEF